jgi:hypothetical protein
MLLKINYRQRVIYTIGMPLNTLTATYLLLVGLSRAPNKARGGDIWVARGWPHLVVLPTVILTAFHLDALLLIIQLL